MCKDTFHYCILFYCINIPQFGQLVVNKHLCCFQFFLCHQEQCFSKHSWTYLLVRVCKDSSKDWHCRGTGCAHIPLYRVVPNCFLKRLSQFVFPPASEASPSASAPAALGVVWFSNSASCGGGELPAHCDFNFYFPAY